MLTKISAKNEKTQNKYLERTARIYSFFIFLLIAVVGFACFFLIQANEKQNSDVVENTNFLNSVEVFENTFDDFYELTETLKSKSTLVSFSLVDEEQSDLHVNDIASMLSTFSENYSFYGVKFIVYRDDIDVAITRNGSSSLEVALEETNIASRELKVVTEYLNYSTDTEFCVATDENLFFISQKTVGSKSLYIICYKDIMSVYENKNDKYELFFWENAQNVLDVRTQTMPDILANQTVFYMPSLEQGELILNTNDDTQYRMYKSEYFDIVYCSVLVKDARGEFATTFLGAFFILLLAYLLIHFITRKVTRIVFYPITNLLEYISKEADDDDFFDGEILGVSAYIRKIQNKNSELKKQLEQMTIKARTAASYIPKGSQEELESKLEQEEQEQANNALENDESLKEKFAQYVIDHISEDIGLRDLAEHFDLSFAYMSTLFKNKMEMNFKEYVSYQRYIYSLDIMQENPKMKIADVAERVGILNLNTYIRIFKKYNDITPKQYMSMLESNQNNEKE